jgi:hypothetical protein
VEEELATLQSKNDANENALASLRARLDTIFEVHIEGGDEHRVFEVVKRAMTQTGGVLISSTLVLSSCSKTLFPLTTLIIKMLLSLPKD